MPKITASIKTSGATPETPAAPPPPPPPFDGKIAQAVKKAFRHDGTARTVGYVQEADTPDQVHLFTITKAFIATVTAEELAAITPKPPEQKSATPA
ncbi:MAG: hypothetical protein LBV12_07055 [Puniceicoccales bacterium]|jgi:hypothetical protein|nr:hypothetical protein [Puniceicoccales bacterium]